MASQSASASTVPVALEVERLLQQEDVSERLLCRTINVANWEDALLELAEKVHSSPAEVTSWLLDSMHILDVHRLERRRGEAPGHTPFQVVPAEVLSNC